MTTSLYIPESAMAISAHPDDNEFTCVGTLARWAKAGTQVIYVLCTSGDVGIDEPGMTRNKATQIREAESLEAARIAGVNQVVFLREPDGLLQPTLELRKKIVREIRKYKPEVILVGDPTIVWSGDDYINHPDHRAAAQAALDAAFPRPVSLTYLKNSLKKGLPLIKSAKFMFMSGIRRMYLLILRKPLTSRLLPSALIKAR